MNRFVIKFKNEETITALEELGEITYRASIIDVVFLSTPLTKETLLMVDGVISVNPERRGRLCI